MMFISFHSWKINSFFAEKKSKSFDLDALQPLLYWTKIELNDGWKLIQEFLNIAGIIPIVTTFVHKIISIFDITIYKECVCVFVCVVYVFVVIMIIDNNDHWPLGVCITVWLLFRVNETTDSFESFRKVTCEARRSKNDERRTKWMKWEKNYETVCKTHCSKQGKCNTYVSALKVLVTFIHDSMIRIKQKN